MRDIRVYGDFTYIESVRVALAAHGIKTSIREDSNARESPGPPGATIAVHENDFERARAAISEIAPSSSPPGFTRKDVKFIVLIVVVFAVAAAFFIRLTRLP
jgi:hypothetical protein